jgi:BCD family chlorophyll transporter-like MFS transporter
MTLSWLSIVRLGLVQLALGSVVVLTTSTLNRLMVVELALPAVVPGLLVALHYGIQITRPSWGFASDAGGDRTRWIVGGMAALACGGFGAALGVVVIPRAPVAGLAVSILAYALIGLGVAASGTSLLALLATGTRPDRRAAAAMVTWMMMIAGIAVTAGSVGALLDPYSPARLLRIVGLVTAGAVAMTWLAMRGIERRTAFVARARDTTTLRQGLREVWSEPRARTFTVFVFLSMTAYFMQELILEPYAGLVFGFTPGQSTALSGTQNAGVLLGMATVGLAGSALRIGSLRFWVASGSLLSAAALGLLALLGQGILALPLSSAVGLLGFANGAFAVAAIAAMMQLAGYGRARREGTRMGLWGAAQALAAGFGGLLGAGLADLFRASLGSDADAFATVFALEAALFVAAAVMALRIMEGRPARPLDPQLVPGD